jgi:hypothetical protein
MAEALQLRDIVDAGYRFVASCQSCGYRAAVDPGTIITKCDDAKFWTRREIAQRLRCSRCKTPLLSGKGDATGVGRCLALERPARGAIAFQGGMLFED